MRRGFVAIAMFLTVSVGSLAAQNPQQRHQLQQRVMERLMQNFRAQAGLTEEQFSRFQEVAARSTSARQQSQMRERELWQALERQLRPGIAADGDSVSGLLDGLIRIQADRVEQARADQAAYAEFLTPVQRAQLTVMTRRLQQNIESIIRRRGPPRGGPGNRP